jgi:hypothetical protein
LRQTISIQAISPLGARLRLIEGIAIMLYEQCDFTRNPIVEDQVFFLESKCICCGFAVMSPSLDELLEQEERHRALCPVTRAGS